MFYDYLICYKPIIMKRLDSVGLHAVNCYNIICTAISRVEVAAFDALRHYSEKFCHGVLNLGLYSG